MACTFMTRPMHDAERRALRRAMWVPVLELAIWFGAIVLVASVVGLALAGLAFVIYRPLVPVAWIGIIGVLVLGGVLLFSLCERALDVWKRAWPISGEVEEVHVTNARAAFGWYFASFTGEPAIVVVDAGDGTMIWCEGDWLYNWSSYGAARDAETNKTSFNELAEPFGFPSSAFVIRRRPTCGSVLGVDVMGRIVAPELHVIVHERVFTPKPRGLETHVFTGQLHDLPDLIRGGAIPNMTMSDDPEDVAWEFVADGPGG